MRTSTTELFPAVLDPGEVSLQVLLEAAQAARGSGLAFEVALDLGAAVSERVGAVHATGRVVGPLDARAVRCTREGRVLISRDGGALAPELRRGEPPTVASDVFAVGHLVYQVLTGRTPAQATAQVPLNRRCPVPPPSRFNPQVDAELDAVVLAALREEAQGRPASVLALQSALDGLAEELGLCPDPRAIGDLVSAVGEEKVAAPLPPLKTAPVERVAPAEVAWFTEATWRAPAGNGPATSALEALAIPPTEPLSGVGPANSASRRPGAEAVAEAKSTAPTDAPTAVAPAAEAPLEVSQQVQPPEWAPGSRLPAPGPALAARAAAPPVLNLTPIEPHPAGEASSSAMVETKSKPAAVPMRAEPVVQARTGRSLETAPTHGAPAAAASPEPEPPRVEVPVPVPVAEAASVTSSTSTEAPTHVEPAAGALRGLKPLPAEAPAPVAEALTSVTKSTSTEAPTHVEPAAGASRGLKPLPAEAPAPVAETLTSVTSSTSTEAPTHVEPAAGASRGLKPLPAEAPAPVAEALTSVPSSTSTEAPTHVEPPAAEALLGVTKSTSTEAPTHVEPPAAEAALGVTKSTSTEAPTPTHVEPAAAVGEGVPGSEGTSPARAVTAALGPRGPGESEPASSVAVATPPRAAQAPVAVVALATRGRPRKKPAHPAPKRPRGSTPQPWRPVALNIGAALLSRQEPEARGAPAAPCTASVSLVPASTERPAAEAAAAPAGPSTAPVSSAASPVPGSTQSPATTAAAAPAVPSAAAVSSASPVLGRTQRPAAEVAVPSAAPASTTSRMAERGSTEASPAESSPQGAPAEEALRVAECWLEAPPSNVASGEEESPPLGSAFWSSPRLLAGVPIAAFLVMGLALAWSPARTEAARDDSAPALRIVLVKPAAPQAPHAAAKPARVQLSRASATHRKQHGR